MAAELAAGLKHEGKSAAIFKADITRKNEVDSMVDFCIHTFGDIDILINNAGVSKQKLFIEISEDEWDEIINTNLKGVFHCSQAVLRYMLPVKKGKIINIASIWGMVGAACEVHYAAELDALRLQTPLQKLGTSSDIAACALFLASDSADFLTGQVISPNGGLVI